MQGTLRGPTPLTRRSAAQVMQSIHLDKPREEQMLHLKYVSTLLGTWTRLRLGA